MGKLRTILNVMVLLSFCLIQLMAPTLADSASDEQFVDVKDGVRYFYRQRLRDLKDQIDKGLDKGWINAQQSQPLLAEQARLVTETKTAKDSGWPKDLVNKLEKKVTALNARISSVLSKGLSPHASSKQPSATEKIEKSVITK